jgi:hypothetical protein
MARRTTAKMGRQILTVKTHSPVLLFGVGLVGVSATAVLACRATLKLSEVLEEGENNLKKADAAEGSFEAEQIKKAKFGVRLQVAIKIAKLYAPAVIVGVASVGMLTGSHLILKKRNAGLAAAYAVVDQKLRNYRGRVVEDLGAEKDYEYLHGVKEAEVVVEGKDGPEVKKVKGLDLEAIKNEDPELHYRRVFEAPEKDEDGEPIPGTGNKHWSKIPNQNQFTIQMFQSELNDLLKLQGHVFLNQAYDLLGFEPTAAGQIVGWVDNPEDGKGDGYISFGIWRDGVYRGTQWLNGETEELLLDFNVDGPILGALKKV